ncbi:MAG: protein-S-isoprenylcysteine O-methyltransferase [Candidatus Brocadiia bacterium]
MPEATFEAIYLGGLALGSAIRVVYARHYRRRAVAEDWRTPLDTALTLLAGAGLVALPLVHVFTPWLSFADAARPAWTRWVGAAVFAAALWLLWRAHADLGPQWSPALQLRRGHRLVTEGVYRRVRHPMYTAHALWGVAQALLLANWVAGPAFLVLFIPLCLVRVPREEAMLLARFGPAYREYMGRTGRLLPTLGGEDAA